MQLTRMSRRRIVWISVAIPLLILSDLAATVAFNAWADNRLPFASGVRPPDALRVDALLVFCAGIGPSGGLDATTVERLYFAADLYDPGQAGQVVAGIGGHWRANRTSGRRYIMSETLAATGLPAAAIAQDRESYDTLTNLDEVFRLAEESGWRRVAFVSSPLHLRRLIYLAGQRGGVLERESANSAAIRFEIVPVPFTASGQANALWIWRETHHEWAAWALTLAMPDAWFRVLMRWRRI